MFRTDGQSCIPFLKLKALACSTFGQFRLPFLRFKGLTSPRSEYLPKNDCIWICRIEELKFISLVFTFLLLSIFQLIFWLKKVFLSHPN